MELIKNGALPSEHEVNEIATTVTMTSLELVAMINTQRSIGEAELTHANFLAKVPKVLGQTSHSFECDLPDSYGRPRKGYRLPKREACLMAMSYSYELQAKVFDRMTTLEQERISAATISAPNRSVTPFASHWNTRAGCCGRSTRPAATRYR